MTAVRRRTPRLRLRGWHAVRRGTPPIQRYLAPGEIVLLETRQHPMAILGSLMTTLSWVAPLMLIAWGMGGIATLRGRPYEGVLMIVAAALVFVLGRLLWLVLSWELERVFVTDTKVIHMHGVLSRRIASTPIAKVSEFTVHQSLTGRLLGYGALVVDVPGGREQALHGLGHIPHPVALYRLVSDQRPRPAHQLVPTVPDDDGLTTVIGCEGA